SEDTPSFEAMHLTKSRLETLSDGGFAFAMTLLVICIGLPDKSQIVQSPAYATNLLLSLYSDFFHYVLAFLILGAFWLSHHIVIHPLKSLDRIFVWLNLYTLLFVALLPFSTSFSGDLPGTSIGAMVFEANLLAIGMGMFCQWKYATSGHRLIESNLPERFIRHVTLGTLFVPGISFLGILIALTGSLYSQAVYLLVPVMGYLLHHYRTRDRDSSP
ncbi:MAG TPA: TMEM175 family protein, partial [Methanoregula sp.]|nr:TMEM175 family protein [Methanoregula sp.]